MTAPAKPLSERERRFVEAYMGPCAGNATKSAITAGYKPSGAEEQGSRLLKRLKVAQAISERQTQDPAIADRVERQRFWTATMRTAEDMRDRLKASELLGRSGADFVERVEHSGEVRVPASVVFLIQRAPGAECLE